MFEIVLNTRDIYAYTYGSNCFSGTLPKETYLLKAKNRNTRTKYEICSKLTIKTPERRHWRHSGVFIVNSEHIPHLVLVFLLLTLNMYLLVGLAFYLITPLHLPHLM